MSDGVKVRWTRVVQLVTAGIVVALVLSGRMELWRGWRADGSRPPKQPAAETETAAGPVRLSQEPREVVWLLGSGEIRGRVNPELRVRLEKMPQWSRLYLWLPGASAEKRPFQRPDGAGDAWEPFLMMNEQDRIYMGCGDGEIQAWEGGKPGAERRHVDQAEWAVVVAKYREKTGRDWPAPGDGW